jgi:hypothetical protein
MARQSSQASQRDHRISDHMQLRLSDAVPAACCDNNTPLVAAAGPEVGTSLSKAACDTSSYSRDGSRRPKRTCEPRT